MKNEKQLVLFLKMNSTYNPTTIAAKINKDFSELGNPTILPPNEKDPSQPLIIFNQGALNITMNYSDVSFIYYEDSRDCNKLIIKIMELLEEYDFDFVRMGYVSTYLHTKKEREKFKSIMFKDADMIKDEFQLSWYSKDLIDSVAVNVWERHFTDFHNKVEFISIFDINTPIDEEYNINSEFVSGFLQKCDKFIGDKLKDRL